MGLKDGTLQACLQTETGCGGKLGQAITGPAREVGWR